MIIQGDSCHIPLPDNSINCIITSPPYWSLRKYDIPDLIWDGVDGCEHQWKHQKNIVESFAGQGSGWVIGHEKGQKEAKVISRKEHPEYWEKRDKGSDFCLRCGAWKGQLGLEPTIDLYLKHLLSIMDECKRVLRDDGSLWVNIGDSYSGSGKAGSNPEYQERHTEFRKPSVHGERFGNPTNNCGISPKSLCAIPERFVIAMTDRGWIRRNTIIWHKPNCMPSSAKDRFTVDFEPVYFFVKSRKYWFEQQYETQIDWGTRDRTEGKYRKQNLHSSTGLTGQLNPNGRNRRCVWTIPTQPYPESHFATFPEALIEPMIKAGCPVGGTVLDPFCGSGTVLRVAERLNRQSIGIDLGYTELQEKRITGIQKVLNI